MSGWLSDDLKFFVQLSQVRTISLVVSLSRQASFIMHWILYVVVYLLYTLITTPTLVHTIAQHCSIRSRCRKHQEQQEQLVTPTPDFKIAIRFQPPDMCNKLRISFPNVRNAFVIYGGSQSNSMEKASQYKNSKLHKIVLIRTPPIHTRNPVGHGYRCNKEIWPVQNFVGRKSNWAESFCEESSSGQEKFG